MDIQRGDQMYYRGEVWTVQTAHDRRGAPYQLRIARGSVGGYQEWAYVQKAEVQRVEQVR